MSFELSSTKIQNILEIEFVFDNLRNLYSRKFKELKPKIHLINLMLKLIMLSLIT